MSLVNRFKLAGASFGFIHSVVLVLLVSYISVQIGVSIAVPSLIVHVLLFGHLTWWELNVLGILATFLVFNLGMKLMRRFMSVSLTPNSFLVSFLIIFVCSAATLAQLVSSTSGSPISLDVARPAIIFCSELPMLLAPCIWWQVRNIAAVRART